MLDSSRIRESRNFIARQAKHSPFVHRFCAERAIKLYRRFIPIEHGPFHPAASPIPCDFRKLDEQCAPITFAALFRFHEQVFEVKPGSPEPGGKIIKVNCKPDWRLPFKREEHFCGRPFPEQNIDKLFLQNDRHIFYVRRTNLEIFNCFHTDGDCPSHANGRNWGKLLPSSLTFFPERSRNSRHFFYAPASIAGLRS